MTGKHEMAATTPVKGAVHEVPPEAVELYEGVWLRIKMAGIQLERGAKLSRRLGWAITTITTVTSLSIFTTLSVSTGTSARTIVGVITALAAILAAWQSKASEEARSDAQALGGLLQRLMPLRRELEHALSDCRMWGTPIDADLVAKAQKTLDDHSIDRPQEYSAFNEAEKKVHTDLINLGYLAED
ncbi:MAG TPA: hypothetical protein VGE14_15710 [Marmoricola sp.]